MTHMAEEWTDRHGSQHTSCIECEDPWPCPQSRVRPPGWLVPGYSRARAAMEAVAHGFDLSVAEMLGTSRTRHPVAARACAMAVVRELTDLSLTAIGDLFERDHTTVMHHIARVTADPVLAEGVRLVVEELSPPPRLFAVPDKEAG